MEKSVVSSISKFLDSKPITFHMPAHGGKVIDPSFQSLVDKYGYR
jgi:hypothetical protein